MSNNRNTNKGFDALKVLAAPEVEAEVVLSIVTGLQELPEYVVFEQVAALQGMIDNKVRAEKEELKGKSFDNTLREIGALRDRIEVFKSSAKAKALNDNTIASIRDRILGVERLANYLESLAAKAIGESPAYLKMQADLRELVAAATYVSELRKERKSLEVEAQKLLQSIQL